MIRVTCTKAYPQSTDSEAQRKLTLRSNLKPKANALNIRDGKVIFWSALVILYIDTFIGNTKIKIALQKLKF